MIITICGSIKFMDQMREAEKKLKALGHEVFMPIKAKGVDYWFEIIEEVKRKTKKSV